MAESVQIQSMSPKHMAIADWLLANPEQKRGDLAKQMGVSESWLSIVIHSDVFREYFTSRRDKHEEELRKQIVGAQLQVTLKALATLDKVLDMDNVDGRLALDVAERTAARLGFEPKPSKRTLTEERTMSFSRPVNPQVLAEGRETITRKIVHEQELAVGTPA